MRYVLRDVRYKYISIYWNTANRDLRISDFFVLFNIWHGTDDAWILIADDNKPIQIEDQRLGFSIAVDEGVRPRITVSIVNTLKIPEDKHHRWSIRSF